MLPQTDRTARRDYVSPILGNCFTTVYEKSHLKRLAIVYWLWRESKVVEISVIRYSVPVTCCCCAILLTTCRMSCCDYCVAVKWYSFCTCFFLNIIHRCDVFNENASTKSNTTLAVLYTNLFLLLICLFLFFISSHFIFVMQGRWKVWNMLTFQHFI